MAAESTDLVFSDETYMPVPTSSVIHRKASLADLYLRLPNNRLVKIAHKGGTIDLAQIQRFGDKEVRYLYVSKTEFSEIVSDLVKGAEGINRIDGIPPDMKITKFFSVAETVYSELMRLPLTDESLGRAVRLSTEISSALREKPDFAKLVETVIGLGDEFARHSLGTVVMANLLMVQLEWSSPKLSNPISMAAFFHDIGLKDIPEPLRFKKRVEMSPEEAALWETHPAIGVALLSPLQLMTPDILRIVQEHHELPNGAGFPQRLRSERIFPMAKVVSFANVLAHELFDSPTSEAPFLIDTLAQKVEHVYSVMYGAELSKAARKIFKF
jgi:HD-GYP domain-containing protein (c-di-GMP phosphodiesterase class II)